MRLLRRQVLALPVVMAAGNAAAQAIWIPVSGADNSFYVEMPGTPLYKVIDTATPAGTPFVYHSYSLEYRRLSFVAQTALYPAGIDVAKPRVKAQRTFKLIDQRRLTPTSHQCLHRFGVVTQVANVDHSAFQASRARLPPPMEVSTVAWWTCRRQLITPLRYTTSSCATARRWQ